MEHEKRKIEFWENGTKDFWEVMASHWNNGKTIKKPVEISVKIVCGKSDMKDASVILDVITIDEMLKYLKIIRNSSQIKRLTIEKTIGTTPGVAFFMQEVE